MSSILSFWAGYLYFYCVLKYEINYYVLFSYYTYCAGEVVCIPLPYAIVHIWSLPFGLLLQKSMEGNRPISSSSSLLNARDISRPNKDTVNSQYTSNQFNSSDQSVKEDDATISSHLIVKHPSEEPQVCDFFSCYFMHHSFHETFSFKQFNCLFFCNISMLFFGTCAKV